MGRIIGISGSLRRASFNSMLLRAASQLAPDGTTIEIASIRGIPLYDGDVESAEGIPTPVEELKTRIAEADGLLIVTPEYNNSIPGVLKNAIDWLSRPADDIRKVFGGRPVAVIGATPGQAGTLLAQPHGFRSCGRLAQPLGSAAFDLQVAAAEKHYHHSV